MRKRGRSFAVVGSMLTIGVVSALAVDAGAKSSGVKDSGTLYVAIVHQSGKTLYAAGYAFDKRFGQIAATYVTTISGGANGNINVTANPVTEYTRTGSLFGKVTAVQNVTTGAVTNGKINLNHGTGQQKGHTFTGTFSGTYDSKHMVYTFKYSGTYK
jgi:hypothetical protein